MVGICVVGSAPRTLSPFHGVKHLGPPLASQGRYHDRLLEFEVVVGTHFPRWLFARLLGHSRSIDIMC